MIKNALKPQVLLLYPKTGMDFGSTIAPPHALLTVAAPIVKAGYAVTLLDQRTMPLTIDDLRHYISSDLICVGISTMTGTQVRHALHLARLVRQLTDGKVPIIWGGCHPSVMPEQTLENENVDIVIVGEGDQTFLETVQALEHKQSLKQVRGLLYSDGRAAIKTPPRPLLDVETLLPTPWELVDVEKYIHKDMYLQNSLRVLDIGQTSRGCPFNCG
ncbi:MAG TPA: cobalamin-dependent protein, partial [Candidatus Omnitrophota bacterium]|nr:cobalamin-dependent protein [Candidatus Omnitrophota bacterium]